MKVTFYDVQAKIEEDIILLTFRIRGIKEFEMNPLESLGDEFEITPSPAKSIADQCDDVHETIIAILQETTVRSDNKYPYALGRDLLGAAEFMDAARNSAYDAGLCDEEE